MVKHSEYPEEDLKNLLPLYYKRLFPKSVFYDWVTYGNPSTFERREISFTLFGDIYVRFLSFDSLVDFNKTLLQKPPIKVDIGAIYKESLKFKSKLSSLLVAERELIFDIDLTDYDDVRSCCSGASVCARCWKLMVIAVKILDSALRQDFGYRNILWLFSGRRGVHCWVADPEARTLGSNERAALADYLSYVKRDKEHVRAVKLPWDNLHHSTRRVLKTIDECFIPVCVVEQDILGTNDRVSRFLDNIEVEIRPSFSNILSLPDGTSSEQRWAIFVDHFQRLKCEQKIPKSATHLVEELKLFYCYPRLDINVTKQDTHLLKAPFCVHPKTGRISVPFNPEFVEDFDPNSVPTISQVLDEINTYDEKIKQQEKGTEEQSEPRNDHNQEESGNAVDGEDDGKNTSLLRYINVFYEFLKSLETIN